MTQTNDQPASDTPSVRTWPLFQDSVALTANRDAAGARTPDASAKVVFTPFTVIDGEMVFGNASSTLTSASVYALAARVPEVGFAIAAIKAANLAWAGKHAENVATLAAEKTAAAARLAAAKTAAASADAGVQQLVDTNNANAAQAVAAAKATLDAASIDAQAKFEARQQITDKASPAYAAAHQAYTAAVGVRTTAEAAYTAALENAAGVASSGASAVAASKAAGEADVAEVQARNDARLKIAEAAVADTANPPLVDEA